MGSWLALRLSMQGGGARSLAALCTERASDAPPCRSTLLPRPLLRCDNGPRRSRNNAHENSLRQLRLARNGVAELCLLPPRRGIALTCHLGYWRRDMPRGVNPARDTRPRGRYSLRGPGGSPRTPVPSRLVELAPLKFPPATKCRSLVARNSRTVSGGSDMRLDSRARRASTRPPPRWLRPQASPSPPRFTAAAHLSHH